MNPKNPRSRGHAVAGTVAVVLAATLVGCAPGGGGGSQATSSDIDGISTAWPSDITTLDPVQSSSAQDWEIAENVYQGLVMSAWNEQEDGSLLWGGLELAPALAESWELGETSATFSLRDDVVFHPSGNPFTAADVVYSMSRAIDLDRAGDLNNGGVYSVDQFTIVDDHTVTVDFRDADGNPIPATPTLLQTFRMPPMGIVDSVEVQSHVTVDDPYATEWLSENVAGTGPYYISSRTAGQELTLEAVPENPIVEPAYGTVTVRVINSGSVSALLRGGEVNVGVYGLTQNEYNDLDSAGFTVDHEPTPDFTYLQMATEAGPLADQLVRQAIGYAIPYDLIIDSVFFGRAERADSYVNVAAPGHTDSFARYTYDIEQAKKLMAEAGSPSVTFPLHFNNAEAELEDMAILIQDHLGEIGVDVELRPETPAAFASLIDSRATAGEGDPDALLVKWSSWVDDPKTPVAYATASQGPNNYSRWSDPRVDEISAASRFAPFGPDRDAAYVEAQEIVAEAAPLMPIARVGRTVVLAPGITGAAFTPEFGMRYWTLTPAE
ncbi:ABC transporter substrate-binding protein [Microbacterium trichothecenolyticum]|uniref:ABC transporter substrate-binding protein n=1 Tax=Microbacterium trichothecenolyticum TaxID=69370 RepID=UPI001C6F2AE2|nr:ABC transporter substrate-binding protein [Microbacterium trichothecenolyticum]MBW9122085.1 ABC transporter substrate-binding protein [Microbacterium trichothecenolyticum]